MIPKDWPRPLAVLVTLMRGDGTEGAADLTRLMSTSDWRDFARLAIDGHRVAPRIAERASTLDMPEAVRAALNDAVRRNALVTMTQMAETRRISAALKAIGVEVAVIKGWPLAERLHGRADGRHAGDLDLFVPEERVADSRIALEGIGFEVAAHNAKFRRRLRGLDNPQLIRACKDIEMTRRETGIQVELHWRLLNYHAWPVLVDRPGAMVSRQTDAGRLLVPDDATNLLYLSVHGALHLWEHLKWLDDIARLAEIRGADLLAGDLEAARQTGVLRPVVFALSLAGRLLASPVPPGLDRADPKAARLVDWTLRYLARPDHRFWRQRHQVGIRWMGLRLARDWRQWLGIIGYDTSRRLRLASLDLKLRRAKAGRSQ